MEVKHFREHVINFIKLTYSCDTETTSLKENLSFSKLRTMLWKSKKPFTFQNAFISFIVQPRLRSIIENNGFIKLRVFLFLFLFFFCETSFLALMRKHWLKALRKSSGKKYSRSTGTKMIHRHRFSNYFPTYGSSIAEKFPLSVSLYFFFFLILL